MLHDAPELRAHPHLTDGLARIEAALARAEAAAAALQARHQALQSAARETVAGLDRLLAPTSDKEPGGPHG
jgi:hypothetical protein